MGCPTDPEGIHGVPVPLELVPGESKGHLGYANPRLANGRRPPLPWRPYLRTFALVPWGHLGVLVPLCPAGDPPAAALWTGLPPFWESRVEIGRSVYHNTITNSSQKVKPASVHGGILADDMGLVSAPPPRAVCLGVAPSRCSATGYPGTIGALEFNAPFQPRGIPPRGILVVACTVLWVFRPRFDATFAVCTPPVRVQTSRLRDVGTQSQPPKNEGRYSGRDGVSCSIPGSPGRPVSPARQPCSVLNPPLRRVLSMPSTPQAQGRGLEQSLPWRGLRPDRGYGSQSLGRVGARQGARIATTRVVPRSPTRPSR